MAIIVSEVKFTPAPEGLWRAICVDVIELPNTETQWGIKDFVKPVWQLEEFDAETERPFFVSARYTATLGAPGKASNLKKMLDQWRGKRLTPEECESFDLETVIGAQAQVQVLHNVDAKGRTWGNPESVMPPAKGATKLEPWPGYIRVCDRAEGDGNGDAPSKPDTSFPPADEPDELSKAGLGL